MLLTINFVDYFGPSFSFPVAPSYQSLPESRCYEVRRKTPGKPFPRCTRLHRMWVQAVCLAQTSSIQWAYIGPYGRSYYLRNQRENQGGNFIQLSRMLQFQVKSQEWTEDLDWMPRTNFPAANGVSAIRRLSRSLTNPFILQSQFHFLLVGL